ILQCYFSNLNHVGSLLIMQESTSVTLPP
ncbi:hypothetical protein ACN38_g4352, partial [Penicillium nordicum]